MRTPPVGRSADTELVSTVTSDAVAMSGCERPRPPPACSVMTLMPATVTRLSELTVPWNSRPSPELPPIDVPGVRMALVPLP